MAIYPHFNWLISSERFTSGFESQNSINPRIETPKFDSQRDLKAGIWWTPTFDWHRDLMGTGIWNPEFKIPEFETQGLKTLDLIDTGIWNIAVEISGFETPCFSVLKLQRALSTRPRRRCIDITRFFISSENNEFPNVFIILVEKKSSKSFMLIKELWIPFKIVFE